MHSTHKIPTEEDTFKILKRVPTSELLRLWTNSSARDTLPTFVEKHHYTLPEFLRAWYVNIYPGEDHTNVDEWVATVIKGWTVDL